MADNVLTGLYARARGEWLRRRLSLAGHPLTPLAYSLAALLIYLGLAWLALFPTAIWSPDEGAKLLQLRSLRFEPGRLSFEIPYAGRGLDPELQFAQMELLTIRDQALSFGRLPIFPLLSLPLFAAAGAYGLYLIPALGGAAMGALTCYLVAPPERRLLPWLLVAFASPVLIYAVIFWEHTLASSLILAGAWLALRLRPLARPLSWPGPLPWAGVGALFALGVYLRQETILFAGAFLAALWLLARERRWGAVWAGATLALLLSPYSRLHQALFAGQPVPDNASHIFVPFAYLRGAGLQAIPDLLVGPFTHGAANTGWPGQVWAAAAVVAITCGFLPPDARPVAWLLALSLMLCALAAALFWFFPGYYRSGHGLLFTTPWAILGLCRSRTIWREGEPRMRILLLTALLGLTAYAASILLVRGSSPHGGLQWGARFALTFYPLLAILGLWRWDVRRTPALTLAAVVALVIAGFGMQARGLSVLHTDRQFSAEVNGVIAAAPSPYVVTDRNWLPLNGAPIYAEKAWFVTASPEALGAWARSARRQGVPDALLVTGAEQLQPLLATLAAEHFAATTTTYVKGMALVQIHAAASDQAPSPLR